MSHICGCATRTPSLRSSRAMEQCQSVPQRSHTSPETAAPSAQAYSQRHQSSKWRRGDVVELVPTLRAAPAAALHHIVDRPGKESMATGVRSGVIHVDCAMSGLRPLYP